MPKRSQMLNIAKSEIMIKIKCIIYCRDLGTTVEILLEGIEGINCLLFMKFLKSYNIKFF